MFKMTTRQPFITADNTMPAERPRMKTYPKRDHELLEEAVLEVLAAYGGDIDGREQDFERDVMTASSMKGLGWDGKKRKKKRR